MGNKKLADSDATIISVRNRYFFYRLVDRGNFFVNEIIKSADF